MQKYVSLQAGRWNVLTENFVRDLKSCWDICEHCEAYKAEPVFHPKLIKTRLDEIAANATQPTADEKAQAELEIKE